MKNRLKELRRKLGLKQRELAARLGVSAGYIGNIESGTDKPGRAMIYQICSEFHVRREWLEKGEGEIFEKGAAPLSESTAVAAFCVGVFQDLNPDRQAIVLDALRARVASVRKEGTKRDAAAVGPVLVADKGNNGADVFDA